MKLRSVKPGAIKVPDVRVTSSFDSESLAMFKESIKAMGILEPPICIDIEGELFVVDGLHRIVEAVNNGQPRLQVAVIEGTMRDVLLKNAALNNLRGKTPASQLARVFEELQREHGMDTGEIAKETGFTRDYVERLIIIGRAGPAILEALDQEVIGVGHAFAIARIPDPSVQQSVLAQQTMYKWRVKDLEEHIKNVEAAKAQMVAAPPPAPVATRQLFPCHFCGGEYEGSLVANPNICAGCAGILISAQMAARQEVQQSQQELTGSAVALRDEGGP